MGKIRFIFNPNISERTFLYLSLLAIFLSVWFIGFAIKDFIEIRNYVKIEANIVDKYKTSHINENESDATFIIVSYEYQNEEYQNEIRVLNFNMKKVGEKTAIHINPQNPNQIDDSYYRYLGIFAGSFMMIIAIVCLKGYITRRREITEYNKRKKERDNDYLS